MDCKVARERTSVAMVSGRPNTFVGLVSETANFMAVATFSGVNASYGIHQLGCTSFERNWGQLEEKLVTRAHQPLYLGKFQQSESSGSWSGTSRNSIVQHGPLEQQNS